MKKTSILLAGLIFAPLAVFAGGYGLSSPIKLESVNTNTTATTRTATRIPRNSQCGYYRNSRWYECDTKSTLLQRKRSILSERFSDSQKHVVRNRATRGQDLEREFDRQAAARNKLLRYRRAYNR